MSVEDILAALYNDPQSGMTPDQANPLNVAPGGLYDASGAPPSSLVQTSGLSNDQTVAPSITQIFGAGTTIQGLLAQIYGSNPFAQVSGPHFGKGPKPVIRAGPLSGIPPQFAQAVVEEMLKQNQNIQDAAELTTRIQQAWKNPDTQALYGLLQGQGASPMTIGNSLANVVKYGNEQVPLPFNAQFLNNVTQGFGQNGEVGIDIGMNVGNTLRAPMAGTVVQVNSTHDGSGWNYVKVRLDNGWSYAFGHLGFVNVFRGQRINPGNLLGTSGGVMGADTVSPAYSGGPHIEFQLIDPAGHYVNPQSFLQNLFKGVSFGSLMGQFGAGIYGTGITIASQRLAQQGIYDPELHSFYERANSVFRTYFGREPTDQELLDIVQHGNDEASIETYVRAMPSHIAGIAMGHYTDLRKLADAESQKIYGMPANDSIIKGLYDSQATTPNAVQFYYSQLPFQGKDVSPIIYDQVYKSAAQYSQAVWNQSPHPEDLQAIANAAGITTTATPPPSDTKATLNG